ncbi:MAG: T9SS type A sorting domain-containing protein [Bacteroidota bacterium]|nr:T9SS type A sorting domain-containing protein [Bacteroidota bacterium]
MKLKHLIIILSLTPLFVFAQNTKALHEFNDTVSLPDGDGVSYYAPIEVSGYNDNQTVDALTDIESLCANLEHSYLGDLIIELHCPNGQYTTLQTQGGGGTYLGEPVDNGHVDSNSVAGVGYDYCWSYYPSLPTFTEAASSASTLPSGTYAPSESFANLFGCPLNGTWELMISDNWTSDDGYLFSWSIEFFDYPENYSLLEGKIFADMNENTVFDIDEFPMSNILISATPGPIYGFANDTGYYRMWLPPGTFDIQQIGLYENWTQLHPDNPPTYQITAEGGDTISNINFANISDNYCPNMEVDINMSNPIICQTTYIQVHYENTGSVLAENAEIAVLLDENLTYLSGGNLIEQNGQILHFDIGNIDIMENGGFAFQAEYSCEPDLMGTTACIEAHIYPDSSCNDPDPAWDSSSIAVEGECVDDTEVCFYITNTGDLGDGNMNGTSEYRMFEDDVMVETGNFQINGGETMELCYTATGTTLRLEADQRPGHPGNSHPNAAIEGCGSPNNSSGFILNYPQDDLDNFVEIDCQEVFNSYDPNDKSVIPQGIASGHFIDSTQVLEYKIRFQNTGTALAQRVIIIDDISNYLNIESFQPLSASHNYSIDFPNASSIRWTFNDINLPDSNTNEVESHGYVKFKIHQNQGNQINTEITNQAKIYFDYNLPIITNEVFNTIGDMSHVFTSDEILESDQFSTYPNPASNFVHFSSNENIQRIELYDTNGRIIQIFTNVNQTKVKLSVSNYAAGLYYYRVTDKTNAIYGGKILIQR